MPSLLVDVVALGAAALCLRASLRMSAILLIGTLFLVPDALAVPHGPGSMSVLRLVLWATFAGLMLRGWRGEIGWSSVRPTRVHLVLAGFVAMAYLVGVSWAPWPANFHTGVDLWLQMLDQLLFLWCVIAFARLLGVRWVATVVVAAATLDAGIGILEHLTGGSYAHWWFGPTHSGSVQSVAGGQLERRGVGGGVRVRGNAEFALQYGWVLTMIVPLAGALAVQVAPLDGLTDWLTGARRRIDVSWRWLVWVVPAVLVVAVVLSVSRSVFGGLAAAALVWLVVSRLDRRVVSLAVITGILVLVLLVAFPGLRHPYHAAAPDSIQSRIVRQQFAAAATVRRPYTGVGLAGLATYGIAGTDSTYVLTYGTLGVLGILGLLASLLTPLAVATIGSFRRRSLLGAAAAGGLVAGLIAAAAFDSLAGPFSAWALWLVAGIAVVAAEGGRRPTRRRVWSPVRVLIPPAAVALGLAFAAATPPRTTVVSTFSVLNAQDIAPGTGDATYAGQLAINTVCSVGHQAVRPLGLTAFVCEVRSGTGLGYLLVSGAHPAVVSDALTHFDAAAEGVDLAYLRSGLDRFTGKSTPARTAPLWMGIGALLLVVLVPPLYRRPRERPAAGVQRRLAHA